MANTMTLAQVREKATAFQNAANDIARFRMDNLGNLSDQARSDSLRAEDALRDMVQRLENEALDIIWDDLQTALTQMREATDKMRAVRAHLKNIQRVLAFSAAALAFGASILSGNILGVGTTSLELINLVNGFREEDDAEAEAEEEAVA
jgi:hypothetical protein